EAGELSARHGRVQEQRGHAAHAREERRRESRRTGTDDEDVPDHEASDSPLSHGVRRIGSISQGRLDSGPRGVLASPMPYTAPLGRPGALRMGDPRLEGTLAFL